MISTFVPPNSNYILTCVIFTRNEDLKITQCKPVVEATFIIGFSLEISLFLITVT